MRGYLSKATGATQPEGSRERMKMKMLPPLSTRVQEVFIRAHADALLLNSGEALAETQNRDRKPWKRGFVTADWNFAVKRTRTLKKNALRLHH